MQNYLSTRCLHLRRRYCRRGPWERGQALVFAALWANTAWWTLMYHDDVALRSRLVELGRFRVTLGRHAFPKCSTWETLEILHWWVVIRAVMHTSAHSSNTSDSQTLINFRFSQHFRKHGLFRAKGPSPTLVFFNSFCLNLLEFKGFQNFTNNLQSL